MLHSRPRSGPSLRGFTLVELIIVMVLVAVVSGLGMSATSAAIRESNETRDATTYLDALKQGREMARGSHRVACVAASTLKSQVAVATLKSGRVDCWGIRNELNKAALPPAVEKRVIYKVKSLSDVSVSFTFNPAFSQDEDAVVAFTVDGNVGGVRGDGKAPNSEWSDPPPGIYPMYGAIAGFGLTTGASEGTMIKILSSANGGSVSAIEPATKLQFNEVEDATVSSPPGSGSTTSGGGGFGGGGGGGGAGGAGEMMMMY